MIASGCPVPSPTRSTPSGEDLLQDALGSMRLLGGRPEDYTNPKRVCPDQSGCENCQANGTPSDLSESTSEDGYEDEEDGYEYEPKEDIPVASVPPSSAFAAGQALNIDRVRAAFEEVRAEVESFVPPGGELQDRSVLRAVLNGLGWDINRITDMDLGDLSEVKRRTKLQLRRLEPLERLEAQVQSRCYVCNSNFDSPVANAGCGHKGCEECLVQMLDFQAGEIRDPSRGRPRKAFTCMFDGCNCVLSESVMRLANKGCPVSHKVQEALLDLSIVAYNNSGLSLHRCPLQECRRIHVVERVAPGKTCANFSCNGVSICGQCHRPGHAPAPCRAVEWYEELRLSTANELDQLRTELREAEAGVARLTRLIARYDLEERDIDADFRLGWPEHPLDYDVGPPGEEGAQLAMDAPPNFEMPVRDFGNNVEDNGMDPALPAQPSDEPSLQSSSTSSALAAAGGVELDPVVPQQPQLTSEVQIDLAGTVQAPFPNPEVELPREHAGLQQRPRSSGVETDMDGGADQDRQSADHRVSGFNNDQPANLARDGRPANQLHGVDATADAEQGVQGTNPIRHPRGGDAVIVPGTESNGRNEDELIEPPPDAIVATQLRERDIFGRVNAISGPSTGFVVQCPNERCRAYIERVEGCPRMRCLRCETHFCWTCRHVQEECRCNPIRQPYVPAMGGLRQGRAPDHRPRFPFQRQHIVEARAVARRELEEATPRRNELRSSLNASELLAASILPVQSLFDQESRERSSLEEYKSTDVLIARRFVANLALLQWYNLYGRSPETRVDCQLGDDISQIAAAVNDYAQIHQRGCPEADRARCELVARLNTVAIKVQHGLSSGAEIGYCPDTVFEDE